MPSVLMGFSTLETSITLRCSDPNLESIFKDHVDLTDAITVAMKAAPSWTVTVAKMSTASSTASFLRSLVAAWFSLGSKKLPNPHNA